LSRNAVCDLQYDQAALEFSFSRAFKQLIDFLLDLQPNLFLTALLTNRARDILNLEKVGLDRRSG
jgi:hypothetical protein